MELVAKDGNNTWHFDGKKTYFCLNSNGDKVGKIMSDYISDPVLLWQSKCQRAGVDIKDPIAQEYKPTQAVFKLWEHRNANINA